MAQISYQEFAKEIKRLVDKRDDATCEIWHTLTYSSPEGEKKYDLIKVSSKHITPSDSILLIRAGIHGDEVGGPLTLVRHINEIIDYAHKHNVKLIIYPMDNPSGFESNTRYNIENDNGEGGNNDFLRYIFDDGKVVGDLGPNNTCDTWLWSSDPTLHIHLPKETIALHNELRKLPLSQIKGLIDIHQDLYRTIPAAYQYVYGDPLRYKEISKKIEKITDVLKNEEVNSGYLTSPEDAGEGPEDPFHCIGDEYGSIVRYDGSLGDFFFRIGATHSITVETTGVTPQEKVDEINLIWIYNIIDLIAQGK